MFVLILTARGFELGKCFLESVTAFGCGGAGGNFEFKRADLCGERVFFLCTEFVLDLEFIDIVYRNLADVGGSFFSAA